LLHLLLLLLVMLLVLLLLVLLLVLVLLLLLLLLLHAGSPKRVQQTGMHSLAVLHGLLQQYQLQS
jgi:hypothetical protein